jgi:cytochrome c peroxidase
MKSKAIFLLASAVGLFSLPIVSEAVLFIQPTPLNTAVKPPMTVTIDGVSQLNGITSITRNNAALVQLGKALFWDTAVGSDGMACASCHFAAGADSRTINQINPGFNHNNHTYDALPGGTVGPNAQLKVSDFPLWVFGAPNDPANPTKLSATVVDDVISSAGTLNGTFVGNDPLLDGDTCTSRILDEASVNGINVRRVEPRNTPSSINATFYVRNFWDGRANKVFNGANPFGLRDQNSKVWMTPVGGVPTQVKLVIDNASLASQAVGPVLSDLEMSCAGRTFTTVGTKLVGRKILNTQTISATDSVLSTFRTNKPLYRTLIQRAFQPVFWTGVNPSNIPLDEANFPLFFGLAVQAYEDTLRSGNSPYDNLLRVRQPITVAGNPVPVGTAPQLIRRPNGTFIGMNRSQSRGFDLFMGAVSPLNPQVGVDPVTLAPIPQKNGACIFCHNGPEFSSATFTALAPAPIGVNITDPNAVPNGFMVEPMPFLPGAVVAEAVVPVFDPALQFGSYDLGFYDIGVTPIAFDRGLGGNDPWGNPLAFSQQWQNAFGLASCPTDLVTPANGGACAPPNTVDVFNVATNFVDVNGVPLVMTPALSPARTDGSFKTPSLRNVSLTAPYFHNGSAKNLNEVMMLYNNGGLFNNPNLHPEIKVLGFDATDFTDITNFMLMLTDNRVAREAAPFDHPSLTIPNGHTITAKPNTNDAVDNFLVLPATGRNGRAAPATFETKLAP